MDDIAAYNKERWEELARAGIAYSLPALDLTIESARAMVDPFWYIGDPRGRDVLCLAAGGGQQSAAFGLLWANVTVFDLSDTQLERDRQAAEHYGTSVHTVQGDMRDLSVFGDHSFDVVWHAHSINFVPDPLTVFDEVTRVVRPGGIYHFSCNNPYTAGMCERERRGKAYLMKRPFVDGEELVFDDPCWDIDSPDGLHRRIVGPHEYRHGLATLVNGLLQRGFVLLRMSEELPGDPNAKPGTWEHFTSIAPPYLSFWTCHSPTR